MMQGSGASAARRTRLEKVVARCRERLAAGKQLPDDEILANFPELLPELATELALLHSEYQGENSSSQIHGFDPYFKWLGIPPAEQPPNHYRLLGIPPLIDDADVIDHAADRLSVHLRSFQSGKRADLSQQLLNEVAQARLCLLDSASKQTYDRQLEAQIQAAARPQAKPPAGPKPSPSDSNIHGAPPVVEEDASAKYGTGASNVLLDQLLVDEGESTVSGRIHSGARRKPNHHAPIAIACGAAALLVAGVLYFVLREPAATAEIAQGDKKPAKTDRLAKLSGENTFLVAGESITIEGKPKANEQGDQPAPPKPDPAQPADPPAGEPDDVPNLSEFLNKYKLDEFQPDGGGVPNEKGGEDSPAKPPADPGEGKIDPSQAPNTPAVSVDVSQQIAEGISRYQQAVREQIRWKEAGKKHADAIIEAKNELSEADGDARSAQRQLAAMGAAVNVAGKASQVKGLRQKLADATARGQLAQEKIKDSQAGLKKAQEGYARNGELQREAVAAWVWVADPLGEQGAEQHRDALRVLSGMIEAQEGRAFAFLARGFRQVNLGQFDKAVIDFDLAQAEAEELKQAALAGRGWARSRQGNDREALRDFSDCKRIDKDFALVYLLNGRHLAEQDRLAQALREFEMFIRLRADRAVGYREWAWRVATTNQSKVQTGANAAQALEHAQRALSLAGSQDWRSLRVLAAAQAASGAAAEAVVTCQLAIQHAPPAVHAELAKHLAAYQAGEPWRE